MYLKVENVWISDWQKEINDMSKVILIYGDTSKGTLIEKPNSFFELKQRLEQIKDEYNPLLGMPYSVDLVREGEGRMSVGLGEQEMMLFYTSEDGEILNSVGDRDREGTICFYFGDQTELSTKYLIPINNALLAIDEWFEKGILSDIIKWTEEIF